MSGFRKAKTQQASLKMGVYGPPGSGKTFTALLMAEGLAQREGKRVALIDTEHGSDFYCQTVKTRRVHPDAFDFDAIYTRAITEASDGVKGLSPDEHSVIIIDSISHFWEAAMAAYAGKLTSVGTIPMYAWGKIKKPYKDMINFLLSSPMHVIICGRQKTVYSTDEETDELKSVGVAMRAEGETPYEPHILLRMEAIRPQKTNEIADIIAYAEKDRTGVLAGRSFVNPTFESLCKPLLGLLSGEQAKISTSDETASQDAEALSESDRIRQNEAGELYRKFIARLTLVSDLPGLKAIGVELTPKIKAKLGPEHVAGLREQYLTRERELEKQGTTQPEQPKAAKPSENGENNEETDDIKADKLIAKIRDTNLDTLTAMEDSLRAIIKAFKQVRLRLKITKALDEHKEILESGKKG